MNYHYHLQRYTGPSSRHTCPACGRMREFTLYVDEQNRPIHSTVGKCNRQNHCGYHFTPRQYFAEHPWLKEQEESTHFSPTPAPVVAKPVQYLPLEIIEKMNKRRGENNLFRFLCSRFPHEAVNTTFDLYHVGSAMKWQYGGGLSTAFPQIDEQGRLHQIKVMIYNPIDGKRIKNDGDKIAYMGKQLLNDYSANLQQTFFGAHLLPQAEKVGVVESEKTAMVCRLVLPQFTWVATGGCGGCWSSVDTSLLQGKLVTLFPDSGCEEKWEQQALRLRNRGISAKVSAICQGEPDNTDVADLLLGYTRPNGGRTMARPYNKNIKSVKIIRETTESGQGADGGIVSL